MIRSLRAFIGRHLAPVDILAEIIYGLLIILTFTLAAGVINTGIGARQLMFAAVGCNIAWGFIDAVIHVMSSVFERARATRFARACRDSLDDRAAVAAIAGELDDTLGGFTAAEDRERLYAGIVAAIRRGKEPPRPRVELDDLKAALALFLIVVLCTLPPVVPFALVDDPGLALRLSNLVAIAMLFGVGYTWAGYTGANRLWGGLSMTFIGLGMLAIAIPLGG